jgi:hypothetical protein
VLFALATATANFCCPPLEAVFNCHPDTLFDLLTIFPSPVGLAAALTQALKVMLPLI